MTSENHNMNANPKNASSSSRMRSTAAGEQGTKTNVSAGAPLSGGRTGMGAIGESASVRSAAGRPQASANKAGAATKSHLGRNIAIVIVAVALVTGLVVWGVSALIGGSNGFYDSNSLIGQAPYKSKEEIQAELDRIVEEGMLNISIASVIEFEDGTSEGTAYIENVPGNHYVMQVDITLDDTGEQVYQSGGLKPDSYIEKITLNKDLDPGTYSATANFHALDEETLEEVGQAAAKVTLNVLG